MQLLFVFLFSYLLFPQPNSEKILWTEGKKLTWEDFRGKPLPNARFAASTNTGIHFKYSYTMEDEGVRVEYSVESFFNPQESWYIPEKVSQTVLNHEQTHFDISELHARILRKRMDSKKFTKNVKTEIETIYIQVETERKVMQKKFDAETEHSLDIEKEIEWEKQIANKLAEYESWK